MAIERDGILKPQPVAVEEVHVERGIRPGRGGGVGGAPARRAPGDHR
jgi:hypothetical protein